MRRTIPFVLLILVALAVATMWALAPPTDAPPPADPPGSDTAELATGAMEDAASAATATGQQTVAEAARVDAEAEARGSTSTTGTLEVFATWDGAPAAGVLITLRWATREHAYLVREQLATDEHGRATFRDVPPGKWSLRSDRGDRKSVEVAAGAQEVTFELEAGVAVRGVVRAPDGAAVEGASVWLQTRHTDWSGGCVLTASDQAGRFQLEHVLERHYFCGDQYRVRLR